MWKVFGADKAKTQKSEKEKFKAAYALNLCTISVSQIIDYNDIKLLEAEYEAILNNLNLEEMPKDESLLQILKQLLDVITFFRIQEGDKKLMEKEYAQRMKDAIWSAIPNPSIIVAGGSPLSIAVSLASQVGIGYMNYRKEKAKILSDKENKEWELQRSAIEQFNGLRRELFDTAWRLADEYSFPDEYRITEQQISQFNRILMDTDDLRRYERLDYIKNSFKAYPPFWYYLGNAANAVNLDEGYDEKIRNEYKAKAIDHFDHFLKITEQNLLRSDRLVASCALEKFDITDDKDEQIRLLEKAEKVSDNSFDVLQICAVSYLKIGKTKKACDLLRMLVNESYNEKLNSQLLSRLYISQFVNGDKEAEKKYITLKQRVGEPRYLYPLPNSELNSGDEFIKNQRKNLIASYCDVLIAYVKKCENRYYDICMIHGNITAEMAALIKSMCLNVGDLAGYDSSTMFLENIKNKVKNDKFMNMIESTDENSFFEFSGVFGEAFTLIAEKIKDDAEKLENMKDISETESFLYSFRIKNSLVNDMGSIDDDNSDCGKDLISEIFGDESKQKHAVDKNVEVCMNILNKEEYSREKLFEENSKLSFIFNGTAEFNRKLSKVDMRTNNIVAILANSNKPLLVFTASHIINIRRNRGKEKVLYKDIRLNGDKLIIGGSEFCNKNVKLNVLKQMTDELERVNKDYKDESLYGNIKEKMGMSD